MRILHHQRLPHEGQVSIERLFEGIRACMSDAWQVEVAKSPHSSKGLLPRLRNLVHAGKQKADVHHIVGDAHYLAFALPPASTVLTIHDCAALNRLGGIRRAVFKYLWYTGPMKRAAVVTTISETSKDELINLLGPAAENVEVVPNCVRAEFTPSPKAFDIDNPVVLQVGVGWNKNLEKVAQALVGTPCVLEIVGKPSVAQLQKLVELGVKYLVLGRVSDDELVEAYRRCDLLVFASIYEGFGLPILEAQATGRPVITSNRSAMPEAAGAGALLVNPDSVDEIRKAVLRVISDAGFRETMVKNGFRNVEKFRPHAVAARYAEIYQSVAARSTTSCGGVGPHPIQQTMADDVPVAKKQLGARRRGLAFLVAAGILVLLIMAASWAPDSKMSALPLVPDWLANWADKDPNMRTVVPFVPLVFLLNLGFSQGGFKRPVLCSVMVCALCLGLTEFGQAFVPSRTADTKDLLWGGFGILCGTGAAWAWGRRHTKR